MIKLQRHQIILAGLFGLTLIGMLVGWYILAPIPVEKCPSNLLYTVETTYHCARSPLVDSIGFPLYYTNTWPLALTFFLLMFARKEIFSVWWKFALPAGALVLYWILQTSPGSGFSIFGGRSEETHFLSILFALYSIIIVLVTYFGYWLCAKWKNRKRKI